MVVEGRKHAGNEVEVWRKILDSDMCTAIITIDSEVLINTHREINVIM